MNNLNMLLIDKAAKLAPDAGGTAAASAPVQCESAAQTNLTQEVWRREEELKRREQEITRRELHAKALEALAAADMPAELAQLLDYTDEEHYNASLETLRTIWQAALKKAVEARVAGSAPKTGDGRNASAVNTMRAAISAYYNK